MDISGFYRIGFRMCKLPLILLVLFTLLTSAKTEQSPITVAVAANAQFALQEIKTQFEKETGRKVQLIIGSSGKLTAQIKEGAPFDVFLSADMEYPQALYNSGYSLAPPEVYGYGTLVLWTTKNIINLSIHSIAAPEVKTIAIANPKLAPYGEAALRVMKHYSLYEKVEKKLVYGESLSKVTQYVSTGNADIGFTAKSVIMSQEMKGKGKWVDLDRNTYEPIKQGVILLKNSVRQNKEGAKEFYNYILSSKAKMILKKYGYTTEV